MNFRFHTTHVKACNDATEYYVIEVNARDRKLDDAFISLVMNFITSKSDRWLRVCFIIAKQKTIKIEFDMRICVAALSGQRVSLPSISEICVLSLESNDEELLQK